MQIINFPDCKSAISFSISSISCGLAARIIMPACLPNSILSATLITDNSRLIARDFFLSISLTIIFFGGILPAVPKIPLIIAEPMFPTPIIPIFLPFNIIYFSQKLCCLCRGATAKNCRPYSYHVRSFFNSCFKILAHPH